METFGDESTQRLQELAADLDMILTSSDYVDPVNEDTLSHTPLDTVEEQRLGLVDAPQTVQRERNNVPARPALRRDGSVPAPSQPPPAPPPPTTDPPPQPTDSLSLMQLRTLVKEMPKVEPTPYAFVYKDAATLPEEIEEWFAYTTPERANILRAQSCFATEWGVFNNWAFTGEDESPLDWTKTSEERRRQFIQRLLDGIKNPDTEKRLEQLEALVYIVLGCWYETAGLETTVLTLEEASSLLSQQGEVANLPESSSETTAEKSEAEKRRDEAVAEQFSKSGLQLSWLKTNTKTLFNIDGALQTIYDAVRAACLRECVPELGKAEVNATKLELERRETWCALTILYVCLEVARTAEPDSEKLALRSEVLCLAPNLLVFLADIINKIRWDPSISGELQHSSERGLSPKLLLLTWKSVLVCFGGLEELSRVKESFKVEEVHDDSKGPLITASPLDYHTFRQEISSKYPAYNPPPSYFPLEPDQRSILPPLRVNPTKPQVSSMPVEPAQHGTSILHQPVHIATPAPSPPPSPALGKGGKKQNYQTPHLLPFNYPPLDASSNEIGGKGSTMLQDALVGRKWEGSDVPTSILEAAELFSKRMRATRALKQLWEERVEFMKYERGWTGADEDEDVRPIDNENDESLSAQQAASKKRFDGSVEERLATVEEFYKNGLPNLQSIVMVMMKTILSNVTSLITQAAGQASVQGGFLFQDNGNGTAENRPNGTYLDPQQDIAKLGQDELDKMRGEEISAKAVTGLLLLLLKWFKVSHVLKFEYLTQLLVDANYIPMVLKLLQTQEIERVVNYRCESEDWNFFRYCRAHSRIGLEEDGVVSPPPQPDNELSDDEAAPPPVIRRERSSSSTQQRPDASSSEEQQQVQLPATFPPEVDELGIPTTQLPAEPITNFSWRNFFTNINYLRILQKICKDKAHRNLMLITYKSANHLKKSLKVPQRELRLYTLKLFKNQVPYCGRKWRQGNMRVITAVYLHVRPDLRDDWLSGSDVDGDVEQSVPMEQSLRALTHWHNLRRYPDQMGSKKGILKEEQDFFARELEKLGYGLGTLGDGDEFGMEGGAIVGEGVEWGVGQPEGW
ncbi:hypothetical protein, variant [Verruconis gallopava]|uniref:Far11/STRP C-terminal domain-containing protein n=1 Tax=Verruconis gallopava TaxID=253628 RepID=A0A0D1YD18_9PEZI|nr:uncharacterized protein PV09_09628 [Verruconis gallopava]XP_016208451.1 hypothetical protein, variant [Verruconis gallopava]KIV98580.1 hypothetical protein PV09_09628 [Verruconis gallopava]KIV98581.1 hypothetical protein, variant [Verruconis gallopava]